MIDKNGDTPITCPKCGHTMQLRDSEDSIDLSLGWDSGCWEEGFTCPNCKTEFTMNIHFDITVTAIDLAWYEGMEDEH